jgi:hypothetical protein
LDTSHGLGGDGPEPVAKLNEVAAEAGLNVDLSASVQDAGNHEAGSGRPATPEAMR